MWFRFTFYQGVVDEQTRSTRVAVRNVPTAGHTSASWQERRIVENRRHRGAAIRRRSRSKFRTELCSAALRLLRFRTLLKRKTRASQTTTLQTIELFLCETKCPRNIFYKILLFTKLETAEFSPFLATVIFIGNYTSRELVVQFSLLTKSEPNS